MASLQVLEKRRYFLVKSILKKIPVSFLNGQTFVGVLETFDEENKTI